MDEGCSMPIEILIAPAAPAADSAGDLLKYGLPVGSLIAGILLKAGVDWLATIRNEKVAKNKETQQHENERNQRIRERERENLLELQPLLTVAGNAVHEIHAALQIKEKVASQKALLVALNKLSEVQSAMVLIGSRSHTSAVLSGVSALTQAAVAMVGKTAEPDITEAFNAATAAYRDVAGTVGSRIRDLERGAPIAEFAAQDAGAKPADTSGV